MSGTTRIKPQDFADPTSPLDPAAMAARADGSLANDDFLPKVPLWERYRDKVAIVGFTGHREQALELDDSFELWGLNELYRYMPPERFHRWFEIHGREYLCADEDGQKHIEDLKTELGAVPVYMQHCHMDIPGSVRFPIEEMCETLGSRYWTNCPAEMIGFAIMLGYKEIHVYGVDMANDSEWAYQRNCCEYWLGRAEGAGIEIHIPDLSDLLSCIGVYGYKDEGNIFAEKLTDRIKWLHAQDNDRLAKIRGLEAQYREKKPELEREIYRKEGALAEERSLRKSERRDNRVTELEAEIMSLLDTVKRLDAEYQHKHTALMAERNQIVGGIQDCEYLMRSWLPKPSNAAGGNVPTREQRAADPRTGIAPSGDSKQGSPVLSGA